MNNGNVSPRTSWHSGAVLLALLAGLAGCFGGSTTVPADHFYRLPAPGNPAEGKASSNSLLTGDLAVARLKTSGLLQDRPILYIQSDSPLEVQRYYYHQWADTPANLVQDHMLSFLHNRSTAKRVTRAQARNNSEFLLRGRLLRFERVEQGGTTSAAVEVELALYSHGSLCHQGRFQAVQKTKSDSLKQTVTALGLALEQIYEQFLSEIAAQNPC